MNNSPFPVFDDPELATIADPIAEAHAAVISVATEFRLTEVAEATLEIGHNALRAAAATLLQSYDTIPIANVRVAEELAYIESAYRPLLTAARDGGLAGAYDQTKQLLNEQQQAVIMRRKVKIADELIAAFDVLGASGMTLERLDAEEIKREARKPLPVIEKEQLSHFFDTTPFTLEEVRTVVSSLLGVSTASRLTHSRLLSKGDLVIDPAARLLFLNDRLKETDEQDFTKLYVEMVRIEKDTPDLPQSIFKERNFGSKAYIALRAFVLSRKIRY